MGLRGSWRGWILGSMKLPQLPIKSLVPEAEVRRQSPRPTGPKHSCHPVELTFKSGWQCGPIAQSLPRKVLIHVCQGLGAGSAGKALSGQL